MGSFSFISYIYHLFHNDESMWILTIGGSFMLKAALILGIVAAYLFVTFGLSVVVGAFIRYGNA